MNNGKYISTKRVLENVYRNFGLQEEVSFYDAIEWIGSVMAMAGPPSRLEKHVKAILIEDGRGNLPCDLHSIMRCGKRVQISTALGNAPKVFFMENDVIADGEAYFPDVSDIYVETASTNSSYYLEPMHYSQDDMMMRYHNCDIDFRVNKACGNTYQVNKNYIYTNFEKGIVEMAYLRIPLDEEGYPLIPDNESWIKACEFEILYRVYYRDYIAGRVPAAIFDTISTDRDWYFAQAVNGDKIPTQDEAMTWLNNALNPMRAANPFKDFFQHVHEPSTFKTLRR